MGVDKTYDTDRLRNLNLIIDEQLAVWRLINCYIEKIIIHKISPLTTAFVAKGHLLSLLYLTLKHHHAS